MILVIILIIGIILLILILTELGKWIRGLVVDATNFGFNDGFDTGYNAHKEGVELYQLKVIDGRVKILPKTNEDVSEED